MISAPTVNSVTIADPVISVPAVSLVTADDVDSITDCIEVCQIVQATTRRITSFPESWERQAFWDLLDPILWCVENFNWTDCSSFVIHHATIYDDSVGGVMHLIYKDQASLVDLLVSDFHLATLSKGKYLWPQGIVVTR